MVNKIKAGKIKEPILAAYPRSGTNWTRYCVEYFSKKPTPGKLRLIKKDNKSSVIARTHDLQNVTYESRRLINGKEQVLQFLAKPDKANYSKLILLIRNPLDNYVSMNRNFKKMIYYFSNIDVYDKFLGDKILLHYEDIISDDFLYMKKILDFINIANDPNELQDFINNLDYHKSNSKKMYNNNWNKRTRGNSDILSEKEKNKIINEIKIKYPMITKKYLNRYF